MTPDLSKSYDPAAIEGEIYRLWTEENLFTADPSKPGPSYCIVIPPPNVTGALHLGHAINNTLQDILIRNHRMRGFNTLWVPGIDHAGIATQAVVEKQLKEKENLTRHNVGREGLVQRIWAWKQEYGDRILEQLKRLGCSCDWTRTRFTLDDMCARAVRETFFKLFKAGLIYRGKRLVNWDVFLQTSVSDDEIYHETVKTSLWHIRYPIEGAGKFMVVATTRPETMLGDTAVAVHPDDPRWNWAIGKQVDLPLTGRKIPIIADDILVDPKFGTGVVKVTPAHDPNDYACWQRQSGKIEILNILTPDGKINESGGPYAGMKRDAARKKVVEDLTAQGLLEKEEPYETQVGHSDRSKTPIEPYLSDQWFVKMAPLAEPALQVVRDGTIKFFPERHAQQYLAWLGEKRDWPISRQLWWGHRIPVWVLEKATPHFDAESLREWQEDEYIVPITYRTSHIRDLAARNEYVLNDYARWKADQGKSEEAMRAAINEIRLGYAVHPDYPGIEEKLGKMGFVQDPDVLDTWFSSALWPHSTLGWPDQTDDLKRYYPTSVLLTGRDIITLWVARMVMTGLYNMGQVPFHHVAINPTILDGKGERMSKSKGNGVDPVEIIDGYGADALRFAMAGMATETQDARLPVKKDAKGRNTSEKFDLGRNFCNKLWNASKFTITNLESISVKPTDSNRWALEDRWILSRLSRFITEANAALESYRFDAYAKSCYDFFWRDLCDWYIEIIKPQFKDAARVPVAAQVVAACLDASLRLMHPVIPFITETIWGRFNEVRPDRSIAGKLDLPPSRRLILATWPGADASLVDDVAEKDFSLIQELIVAIRNVRNQYKVDPRKSALVSILTPAATNATIAQNRATIELLAICQIKQFAADFPAPANAARTSAAGCEIFVEDLASAGVSADSETQRQSQRCEELKRQIAMLKGRLDNPGYIAKAPPNLVKQTQDQLAEADAEAKKIGCA